MPTTELIVGHNEQSKDESWKLGETTNSPGEQEAEDQTKELNRLQELKLDSHGLPLIPQPSRFKDDPMVRLL